MEAVPPSPRPAAPKTPSQGIPVAVRRITDRAFSGDYPHISARLSKASPGDCSAFLLEWVPRDRAPERLLSRGDSNEWLWRALEHLWLTSDSGTSADDVRRATARWIALSTITARRVSMSIAKATRVRRLTALLDDVDPSRHAGTELLRALVEELHSPLLSERTSDYGGWLFVLGALGNRMLWHRDPDAARILLDEAWGYRHDLPLDPRSAANVGFLATSYSMVVGYSDDLSLRECFSEALERLDEARDALLDSALETHAPWLLRIGISADALWRQLAQRELGPELTSVRSALAAASRSLRDHATLAGLPDVLADEEWDWRRVPGRDRELLVRVLLAVAMGLGETGKQDESRRVRRVLGTMTFTRPLLEWRYLVALSKLETTQTGLVRLLERILVVIERVPPSEMAGAAGLLSRSSSTARYAATSLMHDSFPSLQGFAHHLSRLWDDRARELEAGLSQRQTPATMSDEDDGDFLDEIDSGDIEQPGLELSVRGPAVRKAQQSTNGQVLTKDDHGSPEVGAEQELIDALREKLQRERPLAVVNSLLSVERLVSQREELGDLTAFASLQLEIDEWARGLGFSLDIPDSGAAASSPAVYEALLLRGARLAELFAPHLTTEFFRALSRSDALDPRDRLRYARACTASARSAGRMSFELDGQFSAIRAAMVAGEDPLLRETVAGALEAIESGFGEAAHAVALVDGAARISKQVRLAVTALIGEGHVEHAWILLSGTANWLSRAFSQRPDLLNEFQLAERGMSGGNRAARLELYESIGRRLRRSESAEVGAISPSGRIRTVRRGECVVRFHYDGIGFWAIGDLGGPGGRTAFALPLALSDREASELAEAVWFDLRPTRRGRAVPSLRVMHERIIAPLLAEVGSVSSLRFAPAGPLALLPLHAAFDGESYLIERVTVQYETLFSGAGAMPRSESSKEVLIGGWDVEVQAQHEASAIARLLRRRGHSVQVPRNARDGRRALMEDEGPLAILHLAGHGESFAWPGSLDSYVALSPAVRITASEWLQSGRRADFVFFNICNVGRTTMHAGDVNGFPLALSLRGARSLVAATGYIPPAEAKDFAIGFYEHLMTGGGGTLAAYRAVVIEAIGRGQHASSWAPYAYFDSSALEEHE